MENLATVLYIYIGTVGWGPLQAANYSVKKPTSYESNVAVNKLIR